MWVVRVLVLTGARADAAFSARSCAAWESSEDEVVSMDVLTLLKTLRAAGELLRCLPVPPVVLRR
jgi:hypothetical protein